MGTRGTVLWTRKETAEIPPAAIEELDRRHLIRAELRAGARWYELTHDRLIEPIRGIAVRFHLVPRSMRMKAMVKRILYGNLPRLGAVHDGMATFAEPTELDTAVKYTSAFKTLYAVGVATPR